MQYRRTTKSCGVDRKHVSDIRSQCAERPAGTFFPQRDFAFGLLRERQLRERNMHGLIYLVGLIVVILFILSLLGLR
jgi:hypothetical protein